ncbi:hypothetical protein DB347_00895 [Opitutaceae bacterium EW11]|nr:hypothetical protein DB347_00895 [Opitutaceae bacterium EW11]
MADSSSANAHRWKFVRIGGLDQVALETAADLLNLEHLDQKLWVALSCPVKGLELDEKTLALIDADNDGRIRVPELIAAVKWAAARLSDPGSLLKGDEELPLAAINANTADGQAVLSSAKQILANLGKKDAAAIGVANTSDTARIFAASPLNGDGVITPDATTDAATSKLISDIVATLGGVPDRSGALGTNGEKIAAFFQELADFIVWQDAGKAVAVFGENTAPAYAALQAVRAKIDDYFARCRLAAFDPRALGALNRSESEYLAIAAKDMKITAEEVAGFPLATIAAGKPLPLTEGLNPAWAGAIASFHKLLVVPSYNASKTSLTESEWAQLTARFAGYEGWLAVKKGAAVEKLGLSRAREIAAGNSGDALTALLAKDKALEPQFKAISDVDRLARYYRDLRTLLHNFVNFTDLYSPIRDAIFQSGTLFLDARSTELCIRVDAPNPLAAMSKAYIAYCNVTRAGSPPMTVAACITQGDSDYLFVGRHGVFYDRKGRDWDAVVTAIVDNPISIRQAFWSPYKKFIRMIEEQVAKRAAAAEAASSSKLAAAAEKTAQVDKTKPEQPPKKVDVGTVAAIGVAITGAISALTLILGYVFGMKAWQYPLAFLGIVLVISGPSMIIAWLKLRQRTLGPILEGNGWAVNGRVKINIPFGTALTAVAKLPPGAQRSLKDPYEDKGAKRRRRTFILVVLLLILATAAIWIRWDHNQHGHYFWEPEPPKPAAPVQSAQTPGTPAQPAAPAPQAQPPAK